jgi:hypothetical protein
MAASRFIGSASRISPVSATRPSGSISFHGEPGCQSVSAVTPNQYCFMNAGVVSASHNFCGVVRM